MAILEPTRILPLAKAASVDQIPQEICETDIYDQTKETVNQNLAEQLKRYEEQTGVSPKVVILRNGQRDFGLDSEDAAAGFAKQIAQDCVTDDPNQVIAVIGGRTNATDVRTFYTLPYPIGSNEGLNDRLKDQRNQYIEDLQDQSTPYQSDVAALFRNISAETGTEEPAGPPINVPFVKIGGGLTGFLVLGSLGARIVRGTQVAGRYRSARAALNSGNSILGEALNGPLGDPSKGLNALLAIIPDGDADEERKIAEKAQEVLTKIQLKIDELKADKKSNSKLLPSKVQADRFLGQSEQLAQLAEETKVQVETVTEALQVQMGKINEFVSTFTQSVSSVKELVESYESQGWKMSFYRAKLEEYLTTYEKVEQLRTQNYVSEPYELIDGIDELVAQTILELNGLETELNSKNAIHSKLVDAVSLAETRRNNAGVIIEDIKSVYALGNYEDLLDDIQDCDALLENIRQAVKDSQFKLFVKDDAEMRAFDEIVASANIDISRALEITSLVEQRRTQLNILAKSLKLDLNTFVEKVKDANDKAQIETVDVEEATRQKMARLFDDVEELANELNIEKPNYFEVNAHFAELKQSFEFISRNVKQEIAEMETLRESIKTNHAAIEVSLPDLQKYVKKSGVKNTTQKEAEDLALDELDTSGSREQLRELDAHLDQLAETVTDLKSKAKREYNNAQAAQRSHDSAIAASSSISTISTIDIGGGGGGVGGTF